MFLWVSVFTRVYFIWGDNSPLTVYASATEGGAGGIIKANFSDHPPPPLVYSLSLFDVCVIINQMYYYQYILFSPRLSKIQLGPTVHLAAGKVRAFNHLDAAKLTGDLMLAVFGRGMLVKSSLTGSRNKDGLAKTPSPRSK